jgi:hypothetical protein
MKATEEESSRLLHIRNAMNSVNRISGIHGFCF